MRLETENESWYSKEIDFETTSEGRTLLISSLPGKRIESSYREDKIVDMYEISFGKSYWHEESKTNRTYGVTIRTQTPPDVVINNDGSSYNLVRGTIEIGASQVGVVEDVERKTSMKLGMLWGLSYETRIFQ